MAIVLAGACSGDDDTTAADAGDSGIDASDDGRPDEAGASDTSMPDGGEPANNLPNNQVRVAEGVLEGELSDSVFHFFAIPFAAPPTGDLRWRSPQPVEPWEDVRDATQLAASCAQGAGAISDVGETDEDCLYLNVWTPDIGPDELLPVMVWLHPGSNLNGGAAERGSEGGLGFDGQRFIEAAPRPVVVVTLNYRLGPFGFLAHAGLTAEEGTSGNYGLMDQQAALRWVRDNISAFRGDPDNVTLFGESAGAIDAFLQMMSPQGAELIDRAILESGVWYMNERWRQDREEAEAGCAAFAEFLGCGGEDEDDAEVVACLRALSAEELLELPDRETLPGGPLYQVRRPWSFAPIFDGVFLPERVVDIVAHDRHARVPIIAGSNAQEGVLFHHAAVGAIAPADESEYLAALERRFGDSADAVAAEYPVADYASPNDALAEITGDALLVCPTREMARALTARGDAVFEYNNEHAPSSGLFALFGASHGAELGLVWDSLEDPTPADEAVAAAMIDYWTRFAYTGDPNGDDAAEWPVFDSDSDPELVFDDPLTTAIGRKTAECDFWETIQ